MERSLDQDSLATIGSTTSFWSSRRNGLLGDSDFVISASPRVLAGDSFVGVTEPDCVRTEIEVEVVDRLAFAVDAMELLWLSLSVLNASGAETTFGTGTFGLKKPFRLLCPFAGWPLVTAGACLDPLDLLRFNDRDVVTSAGRLPFVFAGSAVLAMGAVFGEGGASALFSIVLDVIDGAGDAGAFF